MYRPLLDVCTHGLREALGDDLHSVRVYGSVATGQAVPGRSDLDLWWLSAVSTPT